MDINNRIFFMFLCLPACYYGQVLTAGVTGGVLFSEINEKQRPNLCITAGYRLSVLTTELAFNHSFTQNEDYLQDYSAGIGLTAFYKKRLNFAGIVGINLLHSPNNQNQNYPYYYSKFSGFFRVNVHYRLKNVNRIIFRLSAETSPASYRLDVKNAAPTVVRKINFGLLFVLNKNKNKQA